MPKTETAKSSPESKPAAAKGPAKVVSAEAELLKTLSNRLSILEDKFQRLVVSHRFQF